MYCYGHNNLSEILSIWAQLTKRGEKMIKQSCMFTRGLSDNVLGWSEHRELLEEIAEFFFFFVWTLSLCAACHTAMLKVQWGMFSWSNSDWQLAAHSLSSLTLASYVSLICTCFIFGTHHKNMEWIHVSVKILKTVFMPGTELTVSLWVWPQHKKSKS